jgi:hypothetical protein
MSVGRIKISAQKRAVIGFLKSEEGHQIAALSGRS